MNKKVKVLEDKVAGLLALDFGEREVIALARLLLYEAALNGSFKNDYDEGNFTRSDTEELTTLEKIGYFEVAYTDNKDD